MANMVFKEYYEQNYIKDKRNSWSGLLAHVPFIFFKKGTDIWHKHNAVKRRFSNIMDYKF